VVARIRFAAARGLCVDLDYVTGTGRRALRRIEPYALRRSQDGHLVLHARRAGGRLHRAYRVERIRGARLTRQRFTPSRPPELGTWPDEG
jgi:predicted DNA-binding transcriptional regulator YafY